MGKEKNKNRRDHHEEQQAAAAEEAADEKQESRARSTSKDAGDAHFKRSADVKGTPQKQAVGSRQQSTLPFSSTTTYLPTNFTILAHHAWHNLTLGLGTRKSKVILFVFESEAMKAAVDGLWPPVIPLGEVNRRLVRSLAGCEMARFKFRKGCLTFYIYAVRRAGTIGFWRTDDLRSLLEKVVALHDFLDHTAMLALPSERSITFPPAPVAMAHWAFISTLPNTPTPHNHHNLPN